MGRGNGIKIRKEETGTGTEKRGEEGRGEEGRNPSNQSTSNEQGAGRKTGRKNRAENIPVEQNSKENLVIPKAIVLESEGDNITETKIKPASKRRSNSKKQTGINSNDLSMLISGMFNLVSMKAGEHWQVSEDEANSVARPLENILRKMDLLEKVSNVSDGAMLVFACASITLPRVMISQQISKQKKQVKINQVKGVVNNGQPVNREQITNTEVSQHNNEGIEESQSLSSKLVDPLYQESLV